VSDEKGSLEVRDDPDRSAYEAIIDGQVVGMVAYQAAGDRRVLTHTVVEPQHRHQGIAGRLIGATLDDIRARHQTIAIVCPAVADFVRSHPEYEDLVG
jgi:predicted GNAT family acetyltransferase